jgi:hypothetical protein
VVLRGVNELPWPRGFRNGATLDVFLTFLDYGTIRGGGGGGLLKGA